MNFTQMHERLRMELQRRMQRGTLSVSLLARQTGFGQSHLSNFLHSRRQLSLEALDRVLFTQHMTAADLLPAQEQMSFSDLDEGIRVPIVSQHAAMFEPRIRSSAHPGILGLLPGTLESMHTRVSQSRRKWQRFVAIRVSAADAQAMEPLLLPEGIALLDRHYTAMAQYRPDRQNIYAVKHEAHLVIRYVEPVANRLVLRPQNLGIPVEMIEVGFDESLSDVIVGRVALIFNET